MSKNAIRDNNFIPVGLGVSDAGDTLPLSIDSATGRLLIDIYGTVNNYTLNINRALKDNNHANTMTGIAQVNIEILNNSSYTLVVTINGDIETLFSGATASWDYTGTSFNISYIDPLDSSVISWVQPTTGLCYLITFTDDPHNPGDVNESGQTVGTKVNGDLLAVAIDSVTGYPIVDLVFETF